MKREWLLLALIVVATAALLYWARHERESRSISTEDPAVLETAGRSPVGVLAELPALRQDLFRIAVAEQVYIAEYGKFASVPEMVARGLLAKDQSRRPDYLYSCREAGRGFLCTAHYIGTAQPPYPDFQIDEHHEFRQVD